MAMNRTLFVGTLACLWVANLVAFPATAQETDTVNIRLTIDGKVFNASLLDNATTRDLVSLLPMTLTLEDYASTEKIAYLPRKLATAGAPEGIDPSVGDITYYAPWGNLALFYKDFGYSKGLVKLGSIDQGVRALQRLGNSMATVELLPE